jgi:hypothetical protein
MDREKLQAMLSDYLAGELDHETARTFEAALADHPDLAEEAASLLKTLSLVRAFEGIDADRARTFSKRPGRAFWLRFAAALVLAFAAGFLARDFIARDEGGVKSIDVDASAPASPDDDWRQTFAEAYAERSEASRLARSLVALSRCFQEVR